MSGPVARLSAAEVSALRMRSLLLHAGPGQSEDLDDVPGVVGWLAAMQAQDLASVLWSLGARLPTFTMVDVLAALERGEALRTWPMRGTVHLVPARDARWMLELMAPRALAAMVGRRAALGLGETELERSLEVLGQALTGARLTRSQCLAVLTEAGVSSAGQRGYHLLVHAALRGVVCLAPNVGTEQTFVLLDEWAPEPRRLDRDEALATIAVRYFRGHGPTTRQDLAGWTGLTVGDARRAIALAGERLTPVACGERELFVVQGALDTRGAPLLPADDVLALPGFDEYLLGFKDRSLMITPEHFEAVVPGGNGVFRATIVRSGRVIGTWGRTIAKKRISIDVRPLVPWAAADRQRVGQALQPYGRFMGLPIEVRFA